MPTRRLRDHPFRTFGQTAEFYRTIPTLTLLVPHALTRCVIKQRGAGAQKSMIEQLEHFIHDDR